jgi:hypothetical protein
METQKVANQPSAMPRLTVFRFYLSGEPLQVGRILALRGSFYALAARMAGMDENPYKAPAGEPADGSSDPESSNGILAMVLLTPLIVASPAAWLALIEWLVRE